MHSCYLFIEINCTLLVKFPTYVTGFSLAEIVEISNFCKDLKSKWCRQKDHIVK